MPNRPAHLANFDFENNYQNLYGGCTESIIFNLCKDTEGKFDKRRFSP